MIQDRRNPISDFHLERYILGELPEEAARRIETRLAEDPALRQRLESVRAQESLFKSTHPAGRLVPLIKAAAAGEQPALSPRSRVAPAQGPSLFQRLSGGLRLAPAWQAGLVFALMMMVAVPVYLVRQASPEQEAENRLKGMRPELRLHRNTAVGPERLFPGARAKAGDVVQIEFHPGEYAFGAILSVDGAGAVTLHWPQSPDAGTSLSAFPQYRLSKSFELDSAPGFERFHLLVSREPLDLRALLKLVAASSDHGEDWLAAQLPESVHAASFILAK